MNGIEVVLTIGLDGRYRLVEDGMGYRGFWEDEHTFRLEAFDIGRLTRQLRFEGEDIQLNLLDEGLTVDCQAQ